MFYIIYRFKSASTEDTKAVAFDSSTISVVELKEQILKRERSCTAIDLESETGIGIYLSNSDHLKHLKVQK